MKLGVVSLGAAGAVLPLAMGAGGLPVPDGVPWWAALAAAALGPGVVALVYGMGRALLGAIAGYLKGRAAAKKAKAQNLLSDKDPKNDGEAAGLLIGAAAEESAAAALEKAADNIPHRD